MKLFDIKKLNLEEAYKWRKTIKELAKFHHCKKKQYFYYKHLRELDEFIKSKGGSNDL